MVSPLVVEQLAVDGRWQQAEQAQRRDELVDDEDDCSDGGVGIVVHDGTGDC